MGFKSHPKYINMHHHKQLFDFDWSVSAVGSLHKAGLNNKILFNSYSHIEFSDVEKHLSTCRGLEDRFNETENLWYKYILERYESLQKFLKEIYHVNGIK